MSPPAAAALALVVALAVAVALGRAGAGWRPALARSLLLLGGLALALLLLAPWSGRLASLGPVGAPLASPSLAELLQLRPGGGGLPGPLVGPAYPLLGLAALLFVTAARRLQAFWLLLGFLASAALAAVQASGLPWRLTDWPGGLLVFGAVAWAAAVGLGLAGLGPYLLRLSSRLSVRPVVAALLVLVAGVTGLLTLGHLARGAWAPLAAVDGAALPATVSRGHARVLWLAGRPDHGVDFAVTGPAGRTVLDPGGPLPAGAIGPLGAVVTDVVEARTHRAGAMLRLFGIGYVVVRPGPEADRLSDLLARQQDLRSKPTGQAALFEGPDVPVAWALPGAAPPGDVRALLTGPVPQPVPDPATGRVDVRGPATVLLTVPSAPAWQARAGGRPLAPVRVFGWAQGFRLPAGGGGALEVRRSGQDRRFTLLVLEGLLLLAAVATMARPTRVAPPAAPPAVEDTSPDLRVVELAREEAVR
jgi:hypothetical protein